jgi:urease accessory protein
MKRQATADEDQPVPKKTCEMTQDIAQDPCGTLSFERHNGRTVTARSRASYPLRFFVPKYVSRSDVDCQWAYVVTFGGGIVSGDRVSFDVNVGDGCTAVLSTQSSTKIFCAVDEKESYQGIQATLGDGSLLGMLPEPVCMFKDAKYKQEQRFKLSSSSSLVLLDWFTSGRTERGEAWQFNEFRTMNRIEIDGRLVFLDPLCLKVSYIASYHVVIDDRLCHAIDCRTMKSLQLRLACAT